MTFRWLGSRPAFSISSLFSYIRSYVGYRPISFEALSKTLIFVRGTALCVGFYIYTRRLVTNNPVQISLVLSWDLAETTSSILNPAIGRPSHATTPPSHALYPPNRPDDEIMANLTFFCCAS